MATNQPEPYREGRQYEGMLEGSQLPEAYEARENVRSSRDKLARIFDDVAKLVTLLEQAYRHDELAYRIESLSSDVNTDLDKLVLDAYSKGILLYSSGDGDFRLNNFGVLIELYKEHIKPAAAHIEVSELSWSKTKTHGKFNVQHGRRTVDMRLDQLLSARRWGIEIALSDPKDQERLDKLIAETATRELIKDLKSLARIDVYFTKTSRHPKHMLSSKYLGNPFERIVQDILNEDQQRVFHPSLYEDIVEKTDLRVRYPELKRSKGARIQVKFIADEEIHKAELSKIRYAAELVIVSPVTLADEVIRNMALARKGFDWLQREPFEPDLSSKLQKLIIGAEKNSAIKQSKELKGLKQELAQGIRWMVVEAMEYPTEDPRGPAYNLPRSFRQLLRAYVKHEAFEATRLKKARFASARVAFRKEQKFKQRKPRP